jgi:integrase
MQQVSTQNNYKRRALQLIAQAKKASGDKNLTAEQIAKWLINSQSGYSKATWRQYRASLVYVFTNHQCSANKSDDYSAAIDMLRQVSPPYGRPAYRLTSAQKQKKVNASDLIRLLNYFHEKPSRHSISTIIWLLAGIYTGLRPCEWQNAEINVVNELHVTNAKATNGRAHSTSRIIHLTDLNDQEKQIISLHMDHVRQVNLSPSRHGKSGFELLYSQCRACLYEATRFLWPNRKKHISLYSARHQFAANAKFSGLPLEDIAALMGHASIETATTHYGRRSAGTGNIKVKAHSNDVARVHVLNKHRMIHRGLEIGTL